ncbi:MULTISPECIES: hypothetical protein [Atopobiaceae]|uniref:Uncharacterized protein n=1 Tax=Parafannyhessea umbonata TaxID=604330 RepID=A0A1H6HQA6_9ACTN|nr:MULTISPECIES: hypothetical protein [Atopobiaceae]SEH36354.1 hypothetical protein SAMN05216447_10145 [Parafannyhessea umbonata]SJZ37798.1 hypothetical protein SAMN06298223_0058 [Olsenella sp. KH1P3]
MEAYLPMVVILAAGLAVAAMYLIMGSTVRRARAAREEYSDYVSRELTFYSGDILERGITHDPWGSHEYLVYIDRGNGSVHVCAEWHRGHAKGLLSCLATYEAKLASSVESYRSLDHQTVERSAYNAWVTGSRS